VEDMAGALEEGNVSGKWMSGCGKLKRKVQIKVEIRSLTEMQK
jgi:hypothetical protein